MKRIVRRGLSPDCAMTRAVSSVAIEPVPLSLAPVARSHESRCAPTITTSPGRSVPRSSATVFHCGTESSIIRFAILASSCGVIPSRNSRSNIAYSSCATTIWGSGSTRFGEPLIVRSVCSLPPSSSVASAPAFLRRKGTSVWNCWSRARAVESAFWNGADTPR